MESIREIKMASTVSPWPSDGGLTKFDVSPSDGCWGGIRCSELSKLTEDMFSGEIKSISWKTEMEQGSRERESSKDRR